MLAHNAHSDGDLSGLERRLASWQPAPGERNADAILFAAGQAAARASPTRLLWPALACGLMGLALVLGVCLAAERSERLALADQLRQQAPAPVPAPEETLHPGPHPPAPSPVEKPLPRGPLALRNLVAERGLDAWPTILVQANTLSPPAPENPPVLQVWQRNELVNQ